MQNLEEFRKEVKEWLDKNCPPSMRGGADPSIPVDEVWGGRKAEYKNPESKIWLARMGAKGWTMPTVPKEYGGGWTKCRTSDNSESRNVCNWC